MEAIKSLRKTIMRAGWSFQGSHSPQSWGGSISRDRGTKKFNKTTEIVRNTKVSNPAINRVKKIQYGSEETHTQGVNRSG